MAVEVKPTAWGNAILEIGTVSSDGTMPTSLEQFGWILEDSISPNITEGELLQLFETGHVLRDEVRLDPEVSFAMEIIGIPEAMATKFWDVEKSGTGDAAKLRVKSFVNSTKFAIRISTPKVPGSQTLEAPYCNVSMTPNYTEDKGWTANLTISILKGAADYFVDFGVVAAA